MQRDVHIQDRDGGGIQSGGGDTCGGDSFRKREVPKLPYLPIRHYNLYKLKKGIKEGGNVPMSIIFAVASNSCKVPASSRMESSWRSVSCPTRQVI